MTTWECGVRLTPMTIEGDPPRRMTGVFWVCDGLAVGGEVYDAPEVTDAELVASYDKAVTAPARGAPGGRPTKVRVDSAALAKRIRPLLRGVRI